MIQRTKEIITEVARDSLLGYVTGAAIGGGGACFEILMLVDRREMPEDVYDTLMLSCLLIYLGVTFGSIIGLELGFSYGVCKAGYGACKAGYRLFKSFLPEFLIEKRPESLTLERLEKARSSGEFSEVEKEIDAITRKFNEIVDQYDEAIYLSINNENATYAKSNQHEESREVSKMVTEYLFFKQYNKSLPRESKNIGLITKSLT